MVKHRLHVLIQHAGSCKGCLRRVSCNMLNGLAWQVSDLWQRKEAMHHQRWGDLCRFFEHAGRFSATAAALRLSRSLHARMWDSYLATCRQVNGIGKLLGEKLLAGGCGTLQSMLAADSRVLERIVEKGYPWGDTKKSEIQGLLPPTCSIDLKFKGGFCSHAPFYGSTKLHCTLQGPGRFNVYCAQVQSWFLLL
jgi:hypothetical protein